MDKIVDVFLSWQIVLISFCTFIVLSTIKRLGTKKNDEKKIVGGFAHSKPWKMLQPVFPYPIAVGLVFIPGVPLPELATSTLAVKIMFALVAGWLADKVFQIVKGVLEKAGVKFPEKE
jgi:hypothetical protein